MIKLKNSIKIKNILLKLPEDEREYIIPAAAIAHAYALNAASQISPPVEEDVYYANFFLCYENNRILLHALNKMASDMEWILGSSRMYNTDRPLLYEDVHKNWDSIRKGVIRQETHPFVEVARHKIITERQETGA